MRTVVEFAAKRRGDQDTMEKTLYPFVAQAMKKFPADGWYNELLAEVARQYLGVFHEEGGKGEPDPSAADFVADVRATLDKTKDPDTNTVDRVSTWLSTAILNAGTQAAAATDEEFLVMEWVTMHDSDVRTAHRHTDGQTRPPGEPFDVDGVPMRYPGDAAAPIELWINCRCALAPVLGVEAERFTEGDVMTATTQEDAPVQVGLTPWHGVLAPEGVFSGDGRRFLPGSLSMRELPMPLSWQKVSDDGHKGSVTVASIDKVRKVDGLLEATGTFLDTPEADEVIGLIAHFGRFGVSVDADEVEAEVDAESGQVSFSEARVSAASILAIPAFQEAFIALGEWTESDADEAARLEGVALGDTTQEFVSDKPWSDFTQADYTDEQWYQACVLHKNGNSRVKSDNGLPIKEPSGALNRNGVHAAAARFNQVKAPAAAKAAAKSALRGAYKQLGEQPPDVLASAALDGFGRGPGWITNPKETKRLHDYWTRPGEPGYAKIGWGTPGDFNRCRLQVGEEIGENSPEDLRFLNQICAQWHKDALGIWPGEHHSGETETPEGDPAPGLALVAALGHVAPAAWFKNPELDRVTHLTVTDEGRVFGHLAEWGVCHIGFDGVCVVPPNSSTDYAYFAGGSVLLDDGTTARTGPITLDTGHAPKGMRARPAMSHYDNTGTAVADVCVGEDQFGIWCAGWVRPGATPEQVTALRASDVSGDWRDVGQPTLEMVAALACNTNGFPVVQIAASGGRQTALIAAGAVHATAERPGIEWERIGEHVVLAMERLAHRREKMKALAARVKGDTNV